MIWIVTPRSYKKGDGCSRKRGHHPCFCTLLVATIPYHLRQSPVLFKTFRIRVGGLGDMSSIVECGELV